MVGSTVYAVGDCATPRIVINQLAQSCARRVGDYQVVVTHHIQMLVPAAAQARGLAQVSADVKT